jgi:hypothetical protein
MIPIIIIYFLLKPEINKIYLQKDPQPKTSTHSHFNDHQKQFSQKDDRIDV